MDVTVVILTLSLIVLFWAILLGVWGLWQALVHVWKDSRRQNSSRALWEERGEDKRR